MYCVGRSYVFLVRKTSETRSWKFSSGDEEIIWVHRLLKIFYTVRDAGISPSKLFISSDEEFLGTGFPTRATARVNRKSVRVQTQSSALLIAHT